MNTPDEVDENLKCLEGIAARMKELAELPRDADGLIIAEEREDACQEEIQALMRRSRDIMDRAKRTTQREEMEAELEAMVEAEIEAMLEAEDADAGKSDQELQERLYMLVARLEEKYPEAFEQSAEEIEAATGPPPSVRYCLAEGHR